MQDSTDDPPTTEPAEEISAGAVLVARIDDELRALVIRVRKDRFEIPKGHVEAGESIEAAALREVREETGILSNILAGPKLGVVHYSFAHDGKPIYKAVHYFVAEIQGRKPVEFGPLPKRTKQRRWIAAHEVAEMPFVSEDLRPILLWALGFLAMTTVDSTSE